MPGAFEIIILSFSKELIFHDWLNCCTLHFYICSDILAEAIEGLCIYMDTCQHIHLVV